MKMSKCGRCGYEWVTGKSGAHDCATELEKTIKEQAQRIEDQQEMIKSQDELVSFTRRAAQCDEKEDRKFMLQLIDKVISLDKTSDELRLRFETTFTALSKINNSLKEEIQTRESDDQ